MNRSFSFALTTLSLAILAAVAHADDRGAITDLGVLESEFYRNTASVDRTLSAGALLWEIPGWMMETDFPYQKIPYERELPFADAMSTVRLLGGWIDPDLPDDRRNDENDLAGRDENGDIFYRWDLLKARLDPYVSRGYDLTLVMDNIPYCFPERPSQGTYGQAARPADFDEWHAFIRALCVELKRLYGEATANRFRFRMGTEMQDERRFQGTFEEYLKYYDYAAAAVKEVLPGARFGPFNRSMPQGHYETFKGLVAGNVSILKVAEHCAYGTNYATGETGSPMDFLARSFYYFSSESESGELTNIQPDERLPEFKRLWEAAEAISPKFKDLSREVHEYGPHLQTEGGIYGMDTGARGAAQNLETFIGMREIGTDRIWHWAVLEQIEEDKILLMSNGWLYSVFDRMRGGQLYSIPVATGMDQGNRQRAMISVKEDEAILVLANWNIDRTLHQPDRVTLEVPGELLPEDWTPAGMLSLTEGSSVFDVIRDDLKAAGLLSQKHLEHKGEPATTVVGRGYNSMAADDEKGRDFVAANWDRYLALMKDSLTLKPFTGSVESHEVSFWKRLFGNRGATTLQFEAACPAVTVIVFKGT